MWSTMCTICKDTFPRPPIPHIMRFHRDVRPDLIVERDDEAQTAVIRERDGA